MSVLDLVNGLLLLRPVPIYLYVFFSLLFFLGGYSFLDGSSIVFFS